MLKTVQDHIVEFFSELTIKYKMPNFLLSTQNLLVKDNYNVITIKDTWKCIFLILVFNFYHDIIYKLWNFNLVFALWTEIVRNRETEKQRNRETEKQRNRRWQRDKLTDRQIVNKDDTMTTPLSLWGAMLNFFFCWGGKNKAKQISFKEGLQCVWKYSQTWLNDHLWITAIC